MAGNDTIKSLAGNDSLNGGLDKDFLLGNTGDDLIYANEGEDFINSGEGNDIANGGEGIDYLTGGGGADVFALQIDAGQDFIVDFEDGVDLIGISEAVSFEQLSILDVYQSPSSIIRDNPSNEVIAVVEGVEPSLITKADFTTFCKILI